MQNKKYIKKRVTIKLPLDFEPVVAFGSNVQVSSILGTGTRETVLEYYVIPPKSKVRVDDGVFVNAGDILIEQHKGVDIIHIIADNDGLVRLQDSVLKIVDLETDAQIHSPVSGRVVLLNKHEIIIETKFLVVPLFMSSGEYVKGDVVKLLNTGKIVSVKDITITHRADIAVVSGAVTHKTLVKLITKGITSIVAPSVDWDDYVKVFTILKKGVNFGVLQGFGTIEMWDLYKHIFANAPGTYLEVDFSSGKIYVPAYDIMTNNSEFIVFKDNINWATKVKTIEPLEGNIYIARNLGESYMVNLDEIQVT